ncbi:transcriptional regulator with XRE-family HTH domain [Pontibacter aydingkolensis]|uniref:Helix-turn-helix transcriptional regulator n=1 Tax=Pontibacter aydingkolensis TaxID=1911536 RepID=A0ABS7CYQ6_9BACT|nr:helix-turn-helix transcriptional regulator [Pontibacter aydingkolensis]MBW7468950.1 helix-turn-helix transcriptional regulator [Pontibacter aydingkolensis]
MNLNELAITLKHRRNILQLRQEDVAEIAGISLRTLRAIENGTANPSIETLQKLLEVLGLKFKIEPK